MRLVHKIMGCIPALLALGLSSCVYDDVPAPTPERDADKYYVTFSIAASRNSSATFSSADSRGSAPLDPSGAGLWSDGYVSSAAIPFEDHVMSRNFCVALFKAGGQMLGHIDLLLPIASNGTSTTLQGQLVLEDENMAETELRRADHRIMIVANTPGMTVADFRSGIEAKSFEYSGVQGSFPAIPMWGVAPADLSDIRKGQTKDLGTVSLLRAMAKIEVFVNSTLDDVSLVSVAVDKGNKSGYVAPNKWNSVSSTTALRFSETLRTDASFAFEASRYPVYTAGTDGRITFYIPEYANPASPAGANPLSGEITLTVNYEVGGEAHQGLIRFCPYTAGKPDPAATLNDVIRNHHYTYEIIGVPTGKDDLRFKPTIQNMEIGGDYVFDY